MCDSQSLCNIRKLHDIQDIEDINKSGTTILLVEQNANRALHISDKGYVLETGYVVKTGTGNDLLVDPAVRAAYLGG
mgnify:CR=1 FL=1